MNLYTNKASTITASYLPEKKFIFPNRKLQCFFDEIKRNYAVHTHHLNPVSHKLWSQYNSKRLYKATFPPRHTQD